MGACQLAVSLRDQGYEGPITLIDSDEALPYHKPPLSKSFLKDPHSRPLPLRPASAYDDRGIERIVARVTEINSERRAVALAGGVSIAYEELILATGSRSRGLAHWPSASNVFSLRSLADAEALRAAVCEARRVVIVGGGFIGLEVAASLRSIGRDVVVTETADRILKRVCAPEISAAIAAVVEGMGVTLMCDVRIREARAECGRISTLVTEHAVLPCDLVIVGIGASAEIGLANSVSAAEGDGLIVDHSLRTAVPHVWAIGDVANFPDPHTGARKQFASVQNATDQARHVARSLATSQPAPFHVVPWFWSDVGSAKLQIGGDSEGSTTRIARTDMDRLGIYHLRGDELIAVETINSPAEHMLARRLLASKFNPTAEEIEAGPEVLRTLLAV